MASLKKWLLDRVEAFNRIRRIARTRPLVDAEFYFRAYPDVQAARYDPAIHYDEHGWREGRDPSPRFSTRRYLAVFPEVAARAVNPLDDFLRRRARLDHDALAKNVARVEDKDEAAYRSAFDVEFYLRQSEPFSDLIGDPFDHYETIGWRRGLDPSPLFSTTYYLKANPDVAVAEINPFRHYVLHGEREGRFGLSYEARTRRADHRPLVSVVVPNYNHERFLRRRLDSIVGQTYSNIEVVVLDDASTDGSVALIESLRARHPVIRDVIVNEHNLGQVFGQWRKGVEAARGELIWICESDDFCEPDFLEKLVPFFADRSVTLAFGRVQFATEDGTPAPGLDAYREEAEPGVWEGERIQSASEWFRGAFAVANVIPNVGGCVLRRGAISAAEWEQAATFNILGDWFVYLAAARGGRIAWCPDAVAYFRQHGRNTSVLAFEEPVYYREHETIMALIRRAWGPPDAIVRKFVERVRYQYDRASLAARGVEFETLCSLTRLLSIERTRPHVVFGILGFKLGGGEIFPINLANELVNRNFIVSVVVFETVDENLDIRRRLDPKIAIYDRALVQDMEIAEFFPKVGASLFHSHHIRLDYMLLVDYAISPGVPYVVTLHGSHSGANIHDADLRAMIRGVDRWVYLTTKNLEHLAGIPLSPEKTVQVMNGVPGDARPFPGGRSGLGLDADDIVFLLASRAMPEKGWREAIMALTRVRERVGSRVRLLLCGDGEALDELNQRFGGDDDIAFLGFQDRVQGLVTLSDCVLLPTRYHGESAPLTLIEAMIRGKAVIATSVGEIPSMVRAGDLEAGILIDPVADDEAFIAALAEAMLRMTDRTFRENRAGHSASLGERYRMSICVDAYQAIYEQLGVTIGSDFAARIASSDHSGS